MRDHTCVSQLPKPTVPTFNFYTTDHGVNFRRPETSHSSVPDPSSWTELHYLLRHFWWFNVERPRASGEIRTPNGCHSTPTPRILLLPPQPSFLLCSEKHMSRMNRMERWRF